MYLQKLSLHKIKSKLVFWLMETNLYRWLLKYVVPYIRFTTYYTCMTGQKATQIVSLAQDGDLLLTVDKKKLTGLLIPGTVDHAAVVVGNGLAAEMTHKDFTVSHILDVCFQSDRVILMRLKDLSGGYGEAVAKKALSFKDVQYDTTFSLGVSALYCSELFYHSDFEKRAMVNLDDLVGLGRPYISPEGLLHAEGLALVADTDQM